MLIDLTAELNKHKPHIRIAVVMHVGGLTCYVVGACIAYVPGIVERDHFGQFVYRCQ